MFSFMKKDKTEKRDKKERKDPKKLQPLKDGSLAAGAAYGASGAALPPPNDKLTADELLRLDEVRRSLKIRTRRKEKEKLPSGITADYTAHLGLNLEALSSAPVWPDQAGAPLHSPLSDGSTSEASLSSLTTMKHETLTAATTAAAAAHQPVPPARGILKGKSSYGLESSPPILELDDDNKLVENTLKNELIIYEKPPAVLGGTKNVHPPAGAISAQMASPFNRWQFPPANGASQRQEEEFTYSTPRPIGELDDATAAAIAAVVGLVPTRTPPSIPAPAPPVSLWLEPPGEGSGWLDKMKLFPKSLPLPALVEPALPEPRDLTLQRKEAGDFGFSLRRSVVVEKSPNDPSR